MSIAENNIPKQEKGNQVDETEVITLNSKPEAEALFEKARHKLLDVSNWGKVADGASAKFQLVDQHGVEVFRPAQEGDYFKIDLPAPGPISGEGSDWVQIKSIQNEEDTAADTKIVSIKVHPADDPQKPQNETAHFFGNDASSTFLIKREGNTVSAEVHGRNEVPNSGGHGFWDTIRHVTVALGAIFGFSNYQWKNLIQGFIDTEK